MSSLRELDSLSRPAAALEGDSSSGEGDGQPAMPSAAAPSQLAAAQSSDASEAGDEDVQEDDSDAEDAASQDSEGQPRPQGPFMCSFLSNPGLRSSVACPLELIRPMPAGPA